MPTHMKINPTGADHSHAEGRIACEQGVPTEVAITDAADGERVLRTLSVRDRVVERSALGVLGRANLEADRPYWIAL